jgi:hypothetical protein
VVAVDHYCQSTPGKGPALNSSETVKAKYIGGTIMVDLATGRIKCYHQTSLNAHETITSKCKYEQEARQYGVKVLHYHCDNGTFTARNFVNEVWEEVNLFPSLELVLSSRMLWLNLRYAL